MKRNVAIVTLCLGVLVLAGTKYRLNDKLNE